MEMQVVDSRKRSAITSTRPNLPFFLNLRPLTSHDYLIRFHIF